ncbi:MAG: DUF4329 domain-containing protein [Oscillospiraceae bacterium]|nr:DUF4329 domain-containing protein [Oscillospiraceae bacterium]
MKKTLSILLIVALLAGLFAVPVAAAVEPDPLLFGMPVTGVTWEGRGGWWTCIDEAALAWADVFVPRQLEQNREFGAIIYRRFNLRNFRWGYSFSQTIRGEESSVMPLPPLWLLFVPFLTVASIHTHPEWSDSYFSGQDLNAAHAWELLAHWSYVAGPDGTVRRYDSRTREFELVRNHGNPHAVVQAVEQFNQVHSGTGELIATVTGPQEVTITGEVADVTNVLNFWHEHRYITIRFNANISACADYAPWSLIRDSRTSGKIYIDGSIISTPSVAFDTWGQWARITVSDSEIHGDFFATEMHVTNSTIYSPSAQARYAQVRYFYACPQSSIVGDMLHISFYANACFTTFTATNFANIPFWRPFVLRPDDTLVIPEDTLVFADDDGLLLLGGTLVIDGTLYGEVHAYRGVVAGQNAGELYGSHAPWYDRLPGWLDFILRFYTLGFFWFRMVNFPSPAQPPPSRCPCHG